jgi:hypothetical protein
MQWKNILANSSDCGIQVGHNKENTNILFVTGYGLSPSMLALESTLMMSLKVRDCRVGLLYCDTCLPACEFNSTGNNNPDAGCFRRGVFQESILATCRKCTRNIESIYGNLPLEMNTYEPFVNKEDYELAQKLVMQIPFNKFREFVYNGVGVGEEAFASVLRATQMGTIDDTPEHRWYVQRYLISCILMAIIAERAFSKLKPDRIVMIHGVYLTHGIATRVANKMGIPVIIYGAPYRKGTIWLSHGDSYHRTLVTEPNVLWENHELTVDEEKKTWDYLRSKQGGGRDYVSYHPNAIEDVDILYKTLNMDKTRQIISLYTNVIWDAQIYYNFNVFNDIFDWIFTSIDELGKNENIWLVIRIHPAEVKGGFATRQPFLNEINKRYSTLPSNVRVIPPESDLSSYTLAENSRATLIYGTKMGLEIAVRGIPVVVSGETFNRGKGFTIDIESKSQYLELLRNIHKIEPINADITKRALKYAYYLYFQKMIDFPFFEVEDAHKSVGIKLVFSNLADLKQGTNANLDTICKGIIKLSPLYLGSD